MRTLGFDTADLRRPARPTLIVGIAAMVQTALSECPTARHEHIQSTFGTSTLCAVFVPCRRRGPGSSPNKELCSLVLPAHRPVKWMVGTQGEAGGVLFPTFGIAAIVRCTITATTVAPTSIRLSFI